MDRWLCAFLSGFALSFCFSSHLLIWQWLAGALLIAVCGYLAMRKVPLMGVTLLILCGIGWGSGNAYFAQNWVLDQALAGTPLTVRVEITRLPHLAEGFWRIEGRLLSLADEQLPTTPGIRLNWYDPPEVTGQRIPQAGELWSFNVRLRHPQGPRNEGGFLYHRYLLANGIRTLGSVQQGAYAGGEPTVRQQLFNRLLKQLGSLPQGGVLTALLMGERQRLSDSQWFVFQRTGLAHLIAISGLHLSLVAGAAIILLNYPNRLFARRRSRRDRINNVIWCWWGALLLACGYAWLAGFGTATLRALSMFAVLFLHKKFAFYTPPARVLLRAVLVVILIEPMAPLQPGFWLSVTAVAAILLMNWRWRPLAGHFRALRMLWRLELMLTLALSPLTLIWFGGLPLMAPVTNLVLVPVFSLWILPLALIGLAILLLGGDSLASGIWWLAGLPLNTSWPVLAWLAEQPWQWLGIETTPPLALLMAGLLALLWPWNWRYRAVALSASLVLAGVIFQLRHNDSQMYLHVLDVEQGSALVVERQGRALLIDTGASWPQGGDMAERVVLPFLRYRRLQPELAFISHADLDHRGGAATIKSHYSRVRWFGSGEGFSCSAGQTGNWRGVHWQVLHPRREGNNRGNNNSCVLLLRYGQLRILVPGDIERRAEYDLLARLAPVRAEVLVLAHHGSNSSSGDYFLRAVGPSVAIASRGRNNPYRLVHPSVRERLDRLSIPLLDTAIGGQVSLISDGRRWQVWQPLAATTAAWFDADTDSASTGN
ncbi:DNA internalization-related competence protein ComEC/Rec2 [Pseudidiomarina sp.]|uniref:DNA internalization-related competence protein ComEC/Rec2 n=1 Tax=Pseudidiomarina sp. TaxID=2081707 RepID=UPI00299DB818|nr:DNA internalization-related competence protein ComEC/Rec2 [Pseudidiomarina sp.]MDX1706405.1 DNA internalization-related competence protein ComEC/Rec2 [Pseudidiomarina sp.]